MSLRITNLQKNGDVKQEYILLQAITDINIGNYAIVDTTFNSEGKVSNVHRHFFRFPSKEVKKGEYISLRSGKGNSEVSKLKDGSTVHRFYWGSNAPIWNDNEIENAQLLEVKIVDTKKN